MVFLEIIVSELSSFTKSHPSECFAILSINLVLDLNLKKKERKKRNYRIPALRRLRKENVEFETSLSYIMRS
jgi:hypothetical protein